MYELIHFIRQLRHVAFFKVSTRILIVFLMVAGVWVATRTLDFPKSIAFNDKLIHIAVFFGFAFLMDLAISRHPFWLWKGLPLLVYGIVIEIMQYYSPDRFFSLLDWFADFLGILLYFIVKINLLWLVSIRSINDKR